MEIVLLHAGLSERGSSVFCVLQYMWQEGDGVKAILQLWLLQTVLKVFISNQPTTVGQFSSNTHSKTWEHHSDALMPSYYLAYFRHDVECFNTCTHYNC